MNSREMHYDFKQKLNKIDSQKYRNLLVPEIDWKLNEAQELFVKIIAEARVNDKIGFEKNQRTIDDIRTIVINQNRTEGNCIKPSVYTDNSYIAVLPDDYWFYVSSKIYGTKENCKLIELSTKVRQHDDEHELSPFDKSSFEWKEVNLRFLKDGIRIFTDTTFSIDWLCLNYIKKPVRIHNAQDFQGGQYRLLDGTILTGSQSCELPEMTHREIVDLAVTITAGDLSLSDYAIKQHKFNLSN